MNAETNKQIARSFLESADDVDFETWRSIASPELVASANGGGVMCRSAPQFSRSCAHHLRKSGLAS
ncbi:MAG TPA: hypothetical protein VFD59_06910 [Nocardioidaceae bacterium]|nr:hypothetical protein [Nocardioidaceae bacterium]